MNRAVLTSEEANMAAQFGEEYWIYAMVTPRFIPKLGATETTSET